jgi:hypothetical protein
MSRSAIRRVLALAGAAAWCVLGTITLVAQGQAEAPPPMPPGALAPENLSRPRPAPPFDLTGTWFIDNRGVQGWLFNRTYPPLTPAAQQHFDAFQQAAAEGKVYRDDIGQCWPPGLPIIMTRVWPIAMIQLPTAIYMISGFMNHLRIIYLDGRTHTDPDIVVRTFNGESIGRWDGDTLVVDTRNFIDSEHRWIDQGVPGSGELRIVERIRLLEGGEVLEIEFTMTDPKHWIGEWKGTRRWNRVHDVDIEEVHCLPDLNENLYSTSSAVHVR